MRNQLSFFERWQNPKSSPPKAKAPKAPKKVSETVQDEMMEFEGYRVQIKRKPYKRSMSLVIKPSGLISVSVGQSVNLKKISDFLVDHRQWIAKNSSKFEKLREKYPAPNFEDGCKLKFCGRYVTLKVRRSFGAQTRAMVVNDELWLELSESTFSPRPLEQKRQVKKAVQKFFKDEGIKRLTAFVEIESRRMGLSPKGLSFRSQKSRWGSCSSKGTISLNWKLIVAPTEVQNYVVIHELAHLKYMNHSKAFWTFVRSHCPNYKESEMWLKLNHFDADFLAKTSELHKPTS